MYVKTHNRSQKMNDDFATIGMRGVSQGQRPWIAWPLKGQNAIPKVRYHILTYITHGVSNSKQWQQLKLLKYAFVENRSEAVHLLVTPSSVAWSDRGHFFGQKLRWRCPLPNELCLIWERSALRSGEHFRKKNSWGCCITPSPDCARVTLQTVSVSSNILLGRRYVLSFYIYIFLIGVG